MATRPTRRRARRQPRAAGALAPQTPPLAAALAEITAALTSVGARFALVGGLAVSARAEPRLTRDVDLAVAAEDDEEAERIVRDLAARGYVVRSTVEHTGSGRLATVRLTPPAGNKLLVDLLFASSGIEDDIVKAAEPLEILPTLVVPVARGGHLIAMKLLARDDRERPQDADDLRALLGVASPTELRRVATAIAKIERRGYARGRALSAAWRALRSK